MKKWKVICMAAGLLGMVLTGCGNGKQIDISADVEAVAEITVPENVQIVGLGEATHGNSGLQNLKKEVFQALVENNGCRVFAIEGDFGGCRKVNDYISGGEGTAEDAAGEIGFAIYRTQEMADLIAWMREYNTAVPKEEQLKFYGFDMQRYDNSKEYLFAYLGKVDAPMIETYEPLLADLNDDTVYTQAQDKTAAALKEVEALMENMLAEQENYVSQSSEAEFSFALQCAQSIKECATLRGAGNNYSNLRDEYMKNKVEWILNAEGGRQIFITGHNGHIEKTSASFYTGMGNRLADSYGDAYFAIGTDLLDTTFSVSNSAGEDTEISIKHSNELSAQFKTLEENAGYLDMTKLDAASELGKIVSSPQKMLCVGAEFNGWQKLLKNFYTLEMVPNQAYDGVIVLKEDVPPHRME